MHIGIPITAIMAVTLIIYWFIKKVGIHIRFAILLLCGFSGLFLGLFLPKLLVPQLSFTGTILSVLILMFLLSLALTWFFGIEKNNDTENEIIFSGKIPAFFENILHQEISPPAQKEELSVFIPEALEGVNTLLSAKVEITTPNIPQEMTSELSFHENTVMIAECNEVVLPQENVSNNNDKIDDAPGFSNVENLLDKSLVDSLEIHYENKAVAKKVELIIEKERPKEKHFAIRPSVFTDDFCEGECRYPFEDVILDIKAQVLPLTVPSEVTHPTATTNDQPLILAMEDIQPAAIADNTLPGEETVYQRVLEKTLLVDASDITDIYSDIPVTQIESTPMHSENRDVFVHTENISPTDTSGILERISERVSRAINYSNATLRMENNCDYVADATQTHGCKTENILTASPNTDLSWTANEVYAAMADIDFVPIVNDKMVGVTGENSGFSVPAENYSIYDVALLSAGLPEYGVITKETPANAFEKYAEQYQCLQEDDDSKGVVIVQNDVLALKAPAEEVQVPKSDSLEDLLDFAFMQKEKQHYDQALFAFSIARDLYPGNDFESLLSIEIANLYKLKGEYDLAIKSLQEGMEKATMDTVRQEFIANIAYMRIIHNILVGNQLTLLPYDEIPAKVKKDIELEFGEWKKFA